MAFPCKAPSLTGEAFLCGRQKKPFLCLVCNLRQMYSKAENVQRAEKLLASNEQLLCSVDLGSV